MIFDVVVAYFDIEDFMKKLTVLLFVGLLSFSAQAQWGGGYGYRGGWVGYAPPCCGYGPSPVAMGAAAAFGAFVGSMSVMPQPQPIYTVAPTVLIPQPNGYYINAVRPGPPMIISNPYQPVIIRTY